LLLSWDLRRARSLLNKAGAHIGGQARQSQGRSLCRPKGGSTMRRRLEAEQDSNGGARTGFATPCGGMVEPRTQRVMMTGR